MIYPLILKLFPLPRPPRHVLPAIVKKKKLVIHLAETFCVLNFFYDYLDKCMYFRSHCVNKTIEKERVRSDGKQAEGLNKNGPVGMERRRTDSRKGTSLRKGSSVEVWRPRTLVFGGPSAAGCGTSGELSQSSMTGRLPNPKSASSRLCLTDEPHIHQFIYWDSMHDFNLKMALLL